jgi:hypothetical protein
MLIHLHFSNINFLLLLNTNYRKVYKAKCRRIPMILEELSQKWLENYSKSHPWVIDIVKRYDLNISEYNPPHESVKSFGLGSPPDIANLIEELHFLKTFDVYVAKGLPKNVENVLEVGPGLWTYAPALVSFFKVFNPNVTITGLEKNPHYGGFAKDHINQRKISNIGLFFEDIQNWSGEYDVVINICPNLTNDRQMYGDSGFEDSNQFFKNIWKRTSNSGLFILGIGYARASRQDAENAIEPYFKVIDSSRNPFFTDKSSYPIEDIITARPKLFKELSQS